MTLPSGGNFPPISIAELHAEFGLGYNLAAYRGARFYRADNSRGNFASSGSVPLSQFYGTRKNSPVVAGSETIDGSKNFTIPMFNNLYVAVYSGQGGQGGANGNCANGGAGGEGSGSYLADYVGCGNGPGGAAGGNAGSRAGASVSFAITDANQASIIARYGQVKYAGVGGGGAGGATGYNSRTVTVCDRYTFYPGYGTLCDLSHTETYCDQAAGAGSAGAGGYIYISWN